MTKSELETLGIEPAEVHQGRFTRTDFVVDGHSFATEDEAVSFAKAPWPREKQETIAPATVNGRARKGGTRIRILTSDGRQFPDNTKGRRFAAERQANIDEGTI